jgi:hypothetical protein
MLLGQLLVAGLAAVKRFDAVVLHALSSVRELLRSLRGFDSHGEEGIAD